jgi:histone deacetylase complex regulatory component SIN3
MPTAEFYRAIRYLDKVKTRYPPDQSDTYEQFLEIMQVYKIACQRTLEDASGMSRG